jgi:hypothetical protein
MIGIVKIKCPNKIQIISKMKKTAILFILFASHTRAQNNGNQAPPNQQIVVIDILDNQAPNENNTQVQGPDQNNNAPNGTNGTYDNGNGQQENNSNTFRPFRGNVFVTRNPDGTPLNGNKTGPEKKDAGSNDTNEVKPYSIHKPYCKECEELKRLKRLQDQQNSMYVPSGHKKKQGLSHFCVRVNKKMKKIFARDKRKKPNYSCFNW